MTAIKKNTELNNKLKQKKMKNSKVLLVREDDNDHAIVFEIPNTCIATVRQLYQNRKGVCSGMECIEGTGVSVILIAPKDVGIDKIINAIDDVLNPVKLSVKDLKFYSTDDMYAKWLQDRR